MSAALCFKRCNGCGRPFTATQWRALPQVAAVFCGEPLDLRNCPACDSTIVGDSGGIEVEVVDDHPRRDRGWGYAHIATHDVRHNITRRNLWLGSPSRAS